MPASRLPGPVGLRHPMHAQGQPLSLLHYGSPEILEGRGQDVDELKAKVAAFFCKARENTPDDAKRSGIPQFKRVRPRMFVTVSTSGWFDSN